MPAAQGPLQTFAAARLQSNPPRHVFHTVHLAGFDCAAAAGSEFCHAGCCAMQAHPISPAQLPHFDSPAQLIVKLSKLHLPGSQHQLSSSSFLCASASAMSSCHPTSSVGSRSTRSKVGSALGDGRARDFARSSSQAAA